MALKPTVSVITPLYNAEPYLAATVESVLGQTYSDWEMIIIDDGSTDKSISIAEYYRRQDRRIKTKRLTKRCGPAVARNIGIEAAQGRYIAFVDSDDTWCTNKLKNQLAFMKRNGYAFTHTYYGKLAENGERTGYTVRPPLRLAYHEMLKSNQIGCLSAMYDCESLGKVYMPMIRKRQDYGLWLSILKTVRYAWCLDEVLAYYRVRSDSVSTNKAEMLRYNWKLYRDIERLSRSRSMYYMTWNIFRKLVEYKQTVAWKMKKRKVTREVVG